MGSSCCHVAVPSADVSWFKPDSSESYDWQDAKTGFGQGRGKAFSSGACTKSRYNRKGNYHGELGGHLIFYNKAEASTHYGTFSRRPLIRLGRHVKLFCKAFFHTPLGRMPLGRNNIPRWRLDLKGQGDTLLAPCPRAIALFVEVDGRPQCQGHFCDESAQAAERFYKKASLDKSPVIMHHAIEGSFLTFMVSREQDEYAFIHIPLIATFNDCTMDTGYYAKTAVRAFSELFSSLSPGKHRLDIKIRMYYDHCDYNYFPMSRNLNARGLWYGGLENVDLNSPHPEPQKYCCTDKSVASGTCFVEIPDKYRFMVDGILDRKPARWKYKNGDTVNLVYDAKMVAAGRFCVSPHYCVTGLPDAISLTTNEIERRIHHKETGYRYRYVFIEFVALWLNKEETEDEAEGTMIDGCMARGEITPRTTYKTWSWLPKRRRGEEVIPEALPVKNKYIRAFMTLQKIHLDKEIQATKEKELNEKLKEQELSIIMR